MNVKRATAARMVLAALMLLAATALGKPGSVQVKNNEGCSWDYNGGSSSQNGCVSGGDGCWDCIYSSQYGYMICFESPDGWGGWVIHCRGWSPDEQMP